MRQGKRSQEEIRRKEEIRLLTFIVGARHAVPLQYVLAEHPGFPLEWNILILGRIQHDILRLDLNMIESNGKKAKKIFIKW